MKSSLHGKASILAIVVVLLGMSSTALAAVKGDPLRLGVNNTMTLLTGLSGSVSTAMFNVVNKNTAATASAIRASNTGGGPALDLRVTTGAAPFKVNSDAKVINLNADLLDDLDSSAFQARVTGACDPGTSIRAIGSDGAVTCEASDTSGGDITGVTAGAGLTGGGDTGAPTLSANFTPSGTGNGVATTVARGDHNHNSLYLATTGKAADANLLDGVDSAGFQRRVTSACPAGSSISAISDTGAVTCEADNDSGGDITGVTAGSGLTGGGASGTPTLSANFTSAGGGNGASTTVARGDHNHDSSYLQGRGQAAHGAWRFNPGTGGWVVFFRTTNPNLAVAYNCPADLSHNGWIVFFNDGTEVVNVFMDNGLQNPEYRQLAAGGGRWDVPAAAVGEHVTFQAQGAQVATIEVFTVHRTGDGCHTQAQALITRP